jgi:hypothetical protein
MPSEFPRQHLHPILTTWHITFGTYGTRLPGASRPSVDKEHYELDTPFVSPQVEREESARGRMKFPPKFLSNEQCAFVERELPKICERGGWSHRVCSAVPDHVQLLCDVKPDIHGEKVRRLVKLWLGQMLSECRPIEAGTSWWAEEGSNIAIHDEAYLNNAFSYIARPRTIQWTP